MQCDQATYAEKGTKECLQYFSDLRFEQQDRLLPVTILFLSLCCCKHNEVQCMIKKADSFLSSYSSKPYTPVHFGATQIARKKLSPMKPSLLKNNETNMISSENKDAESIDHYKRHHLCYFPRLTKKQKRAS